VIFYSKPFVFTGFCAEECFILAKVLIKTDKEKSQLPIFLLLRFKQKTTMTI